MNKKIVTLALLSKIRERLRRKKQRVVFTNGTFDILHRGHVEYLEKAKRMGDILIVGLNTDSSIRKIKGPLRPINPNRDRAIVLAALRTVDYVCFFRENTPLRLIQALRPDVLVKGADWKTNNIVGSAVVKSGGGTVRRIPLRQGRSTSNVIQKVLQAYTVMPSRRRRRK
ncbi:MAG TPA: D-glycero-beta-D-manno-heptose 1-phosphate adenylyltransferase [Bacteroidota bacterium]|jgi:D-beta-D-heptose 7-phosphate kinase/D-beta-D-heptose 1-phosphate adenosyltransferase